MRYKVFANKKVKKFLQSHPELKDDFKEKASLLEKFENWKTLDWKKMMGYESDYRLRIGKYRFVATIIKDKILIYFHKADSRGGVYK